MKKVLVYDVAAEFGGALTILNAFYNYVSNNDTDIEWYFIISKPKLENTKQIKVFRFPEVKKNWLKRIEFDFLYAPKIVREINPDLILSLQNVTIPRVKKTPQLLYLHQPIPFSEIKYNFFSSTIYWIYQNIISKLIISSIKKSEAVIVQTNWMKEAAIGKSKAPPPKFLVISPEIPTVKDTIPYDVLQGRRVFFYPVSFSTYKNHEVIIKAINIVKKAYDNFEVVFTETYKNSCAIGLDCSDSHIKFIGRVSHEEVIDIMRHSTLLFPSKLETFGLPLLEARMCKAFVVAGDTQFSRELLEGYENAYFFDVNNAAELAEKMISIIESNIKYYFPKMTRTGTNNAGWKPVLDCIHSLINK